MRKRIFARCNASNLGKVGLAAVVMSVFMVSCSKRAQISNRNAEEVNSSMITMSSGSVLNPAQVDGAITTFYNEMKALQNGGSSARMLDPSDVAFLVEGTYNKYIAAAQFDCNVSKYESKMEVPVAGTGEMKETDVAIAFWNMKRELVNKMNSLGENLGVESFDMKPASDPVNGKVVFKYSIVYKTERLPGFAEKPSDYCNQRFEEPATHVWKAETNSNPNNWQTQGQAVINHVTKSLVPGTQQDNANGAAMMLRMMGVGNIRQFFCKPVVCGYFVDITEVGYGLATSFSPTNCQYVDLGIPDYTNAERWATKIYYPSQVIDPYDTYKKWLTTPMMNFYLEKMPGIVESMVPPNKEFVNLHIWTELGISNTPYYVALHRYDIRYGTFIAPAISGPCPPKLVLSEM